MKIMIDIVASKRFFPLKNFEDVENLFEFNIIGENGDPNLALLSIVSGLIEHSLVTLSDKDDLIANSRPINKRDKHFSLVNQLVNSSSSSHHLSSTSNEFNKDQQPQRQEQKHQPHHQQRQWTRNLDDTEFNEAGYVSSSERSGSASTDLPSSENIQIPEIEYEVVETLYKKFVDQIKGSIATKDELNKTNLKIKKISDSVWEHLTNTYYKDKAHLQSIFSYLTTNKLDCFGLAFAVLAGCQILNLKNIYLALSEDHAWVMFDLLTDESTKIIKDKELKEYTENHLPIPTCALHGTCEVTWHGKANSDKRGQPVTYKNCWLYTNGYAVRCDVKLCVAALVNSINPTINTNTESEVLALLQQRLLWLLFKHKTYFPMSLGNLGALENICTTPNAPKTPQELFNLGIEISRTEYNDSHVYPYSYLASFFYEHGRFKEALETWADASAVMIKYNYSRDDEEIYKEFFEVANELIPSMLKVLTAGGLEPGKVSKKPFLQDPECLALILKFYDNICCWEEGSSTPVLHIGWAKNFVATVLKFSSIIRSKIKLLTEEEWTHNKACASECEVSSRADQCSSTALNDGCKGEKKRERRIEIEGDNNVTIILKSSKIAGVRDLLQAERFSKNAVELQLTAQSQCAVRGRSNSNSHSSDFVQSAMIGGSTRSKRLHR